MSKLKEQIMSALNSVIFPTEEVELEETVVEEVPATEEVEEVVDELVIDEAFIDAKIAAMKEEIMLEVANMIVGSEEGFNKSVEDLKTKVEEFGAQPLATSVKEEVETPANIKTSKAAGFFSK